MKIGFIGLGKMGYGIAYNISKKYNVSIWNRTNNIAKKHSIEHNTIFTKNIFDIFKKNNVIFTCLPTSYEVIEIIKNNSNYLQKDTILIDCTTGDPYITKEIGSILKTHNSYILDCPVSGGPGKAHTGTLTSMIGGEKYIYNKVEDIIKSFSNPIYCGCLGNANAIKSINNILNITHLCIASEGLNALKNYGVDPNIALKVINKSSGRSLMTEERIPQEIITEKYNYGFKIGLMNKDIQIANKLLGDTIMFKETYKLLNKFLINNDDNLDYTEITKLLYKN
jgi:3-hydroxyisobutyrate dehydrogenase